jgi:hypothetical protein
MIYQIVFHTAKYTVGSALVESDKEFSATQAKKFLREEGVKGPIRLTIEPVSVINSRYFWMLVRK